MFGCDPLAIHGGMVLAANLVWRALDFVMSDAWAALDVTVDLAHTHPYAADQGYPPMSLPKPDQKP